MAAATQSQAASALVFVYRDVLRRPLGRFEARLLPNPRMQPEKLHRLASEALAAR